MFYTLHVVEPLRYDSVLIKETNAGLPNKVFHRRTLGIASARLFTGRMPFRSPIQQLQCTKGTAADNAQPINTRPRHVTP